MPDEDNPEVMLGGALPPDFVNSQSTHVETTKVEPLTDEQQTTETEYQQRYTEDYVTGMFAGEPVDGEQEPVIPIRDFSVSTVLFGEDNKPQGSDPLSFGLALQALIDEKPTLQLTICEFGFAEEVIFLVARKDGTYEVGVGESMRPTDWRYRGIDKDEARTYFIDAMLHISQLDEFERE